jgi:translation initiation factor IF-1
VALSRGAGQTPGGTLAQQITMTVTVVSVDPNLPSITVKTQNGDVITRKIEDKKNLEGVAPGDRIVITYTQALLAAVEPAK